MMIKDFIVIDNVLSDPKILLDFSRRIEYHIDSVKNTRFLADIPLSKNEMNKPRGNWSGVRSESLSDIHPKLFNDVFVEILSKTFSCDVRCVIDAYLHYAPEYLNPPNSYWWHKDVGDIFAGVVYLNERPDNANESGTRILIDGEEIAVENKFNRLVLYKANLLHRPGMAFGNSLDTARLTLTMFFKEFSIAPVA